MDSVLRDVRTVKTPRIPRPRPDEDEDCAADRAAATKDRRPVDPRTGVERYMIPQSTAYFIAYGRID